MARSQMNYLKESEILYQFPKDKPQTKEPEGGRADGQ